MKNSLFNSIFILLLATANLPYIHIGPVSLSFFAGAFLIAISFKNIRVNIRQLLPLFIFAVLSIVSLLISPVGVKIATFFTITQIIYWYLLVCAIISNYKYIKIPHVARCTRFVIILTCIVYYFTKVATDAIEGLTDNAVSYTIITIWPLGLLGLSRYSKKFFYMILVLLCLIMIDSRTGQILFFLQLFVLGLLKVFSSQKLLYIVITVVFFLALFSNEKVRHTSVDTIFKEETEISILLKDPQLILLMDKSWTQRVLQRQKAKQIFREHPIFGIGPLNFVDYDININTNSIDIDNKLLMYEYGRSYKRSSHNAYYQLLAENGLLGVLFILVFLLSVLRQSYSSMSKDKNSVLVFIALFGMYLNLYMVSGFWGTSTWIMLGFVLAYSRKGSIYSTSRNNS